MSPEEIRDQKVKQLAKEDFDAWMKAPESKTNWKNHLMVYLLEDENKYLVASTTKSVHISFYGERASASSKLNATRFQTYEEADLSAMISDQKIKEDKFLYDRIMENLTEEEKIRIEKAKK